MEAQKKNYGLYFNINKDRSMKKYAAVEFSKSGNNMLHKYTQRYTSVLVIKQIYTYVLVIKKTKVDISFNKGRHQF